MSQYDFIKDIAKFGLENDQEKLQLVLNELIEYSKKTKKLNFAIQLQSLLKDAIRTGRTKSLSRILPAALLEEDKEFNDLIIEKITSDYNINNLICSNETKDELEFFIQEHNNIEAIREYSLPVSNKVLFYGPSGCGKTLASYVLAGELKKMMVILNLGAIVSSKLGETSKNLSKLFKRASLEGSIIFMDEFDSLGKIRDYNQDHGEMKRVVNTILQLFDFIPQDTIIIAATNHQNMIDDALLRRFDLKINLELPNTIQIRQLIDNTLKSKVFSFDDDKKVEKIISNCEGMSYYTIQKNLIAAIKRSIYKQAQSDSTNMVIYTEIWEKLVNKEKQQALNV